jgi:hypothetical protein
MMRRMPGCTKDTRKIKARLPRIDGDHDPANYLAGGEVSTERAQTGQRVT